MTDTPQRVAIVTGASRGIGAAIAKQLAADGKHVVCVARNLDKLNEVKAEIEAAGGAACVKTCDISDGAAIAEMIDAVAEEHERLDILVNNAGITRDNLLMRMTDEEFDDVISTNLRSVFVACRAASRTMVRGKFGRVINIGSVSGVVGNAGQANYAAAKAGLAGFTKSLAKELGKKNITANVVAPGFIATDMTDGLPEQDQRRRQDHDRRGTHGPARGNRRRRRLPRVGQSQLRHRTGAGGGRWNDDVVSTLLQYVYALKPPPPKPCRSLYWR